jgi:SAM-dependent methyltransferase
VAEPYEILSTLYDGAGWGAFAEGMADRVLDLAAEHGLSEITHVVDVACGTGIAAAKFSAARYHVTGVDLSSQMLAQARHRIDEAGLNKIALVEADMRDFRLDEPADLVTCMYDSLNYLLVEADLLAAFRSAATALRSGGLYIFDMNTIYGLAEGWGTRDSVRWDSDDCFIVARTSWDYENLTNTVTFHGFVRQGNLWERFVEAHTQRGYPIATIRELLEQAGLTVLTILDPRGGEAEEPGPKTGRVLVVAQEE